MGEWLEGRLMQRTIEDLRSFLRLNNMILCGTKPVLARRVADGIVFGALPSCPSCGNNLHPNSVIDSPSSVYACRRATRSGKQCGYEVNGADLGRKPFVGADQFLL